jgi:hypothetical protein
MKICTCAVLERNPRGREDTANVGIKAKAVPLQALTDPVGSRRFRLPDFKAIGT